MRTSSSERLSSDDLRFVTALSQHPSLAAAARAADITPPAVTQRLQQLEERLGFKLFDRIGRSVSITDEGQLLVKRGMPVLHEIGAIEEELAARRKTVVGRLRVLAPLGFGRRYVAPIVGAFHAAFPDLPISLMLSDTPARLTLGGWDLMINVGTLRDSNLVARKLAPNNRVLCAAGAYVASHGEPQQPTDLQSHRCIALRENDEDVSLWRFRSTKNPRQTAKVRVHPLMETNDGTVARTWGLTGAGIILRSEWDVAEHLATGELVQLMPDWQPPAADIYLLYAAGRKKTARTERFTEAMHAALNPTPWRTS